MLIVVKSDNMQYADDDNDAMDIAAKYITEDDSCVVIVIEGDVVGEINRDVLEELSE